MISAKESIEKLSMNVANVQTIHYLACQQDNLDDRI